MQHRFVLRINFFFFKMWHSGAGNRRWWWRWKIRCLYCNCYRIECRSFPSIEAEAPPITNRPFFWGESTMILSSLPAAYSVAPALQCYACQNFFYFEVVKACRVKPWLPAPSTVHWTRKVWFSHTLFRWRWYKTGLSEPCRQVTEQKKYYCKRWCPIINKI